MELLIGGILGYLLGSPTVVVTSESSAEKRKTENGEAKITVIDYDLKTGTVCYFCPRCKGAGTFEDFTSSCTGRQYYERECPVCNGKKFVSLTLPEATQQHIKEEYAKAKK